ncbi:unnamed protein product [Coregonus sp. 'balchen']|nr:unnamed protein product [Coregonus sp. 'balchen']
MQDLLCMNNDFPPRAHCLVRWYGMREFVVISPGANCEAVISESKCNLLLSSISISLANTGCQVPMFVQIQQKWRRMYHGECQGLGVRTDFEMVHLRKVPSQYNHLSGLLDIFKSKIGCPLTPLPPINIAIRFTYVLQDWQQYSWPQQPPDFDALLGGEVGGVEFGKLPFGACEDPISELHLATTWPHLTEGIVVDNDVYSDLDPLQAPHWSVRMCSKKETTEEILGRGPVEEEGKDDISHALSKLTEPTAVPIPKLSVSNMVHSARKRIRRHRRGAESPLSNDVLNSILLYLFPDAAIDKSSSENSEIKASQLNTDGKPEEKDSDDYNLYNQLKSAPSDSLTYRLALCVCLVNFYHGGVRAVAHLWQEFVLEMRYRWENNYLVYGLASGPPDLRCCLLHQKLQMLNCCIERKRARDDGRKTIEGGKARERERERKVAGSTGTENGRLGPESAATAEGGREVSPGKSWDSWSDSEGEDEFFECLSDTEEMKDGAATDGEKGGAKVAKPEGRLHPHGKLTLLNSQEPLYIPVTQEPAPMTEDLLEEQSEVLAKLGTSAEGYGGAPVCPALGPQATEELLSVLPWAHRLRRSSCLSCPGPTGYGGAPVCPALGPQATEELLSVMPWAHRTTEELLSVSPGPQLRRSSCLFCPGPQATESSCLSCPGPQATEELPVCPALGPQLGGAPVCPALGPQATEELLSVLPWAHRLRRSSCLSCPGPTGYGGAPVSAANPGCTLEDFVRWYSPRDYVEEEVVDEIGDTVVRGDLSARMKIPGNMWMEAWATAKTTPARRQRRLAATFIRMSATSQPALLGKFQVLHYLAVQKPADLSRHLLPCILHAAILKEKEEESVEDILSARKAIQQATSHASKVLRHPSPDYKKLEDVITQLIAVETVIARSRSLKSKFGIGKAEQSDDAEDLERFVNSLLEEPEVYVIGAGRGPAGSIIHKLFVSAQRALRGSWACCLRREILLRTCVPRPAPYSKALPQRLFCVLMREDFRLAGAFSSDSSFF